MLSIAKISLLALLALTLSVDSLVEANAASFKDPIHASRVLEGSSASGSQGLASATASTAASAASSTASSSESATSAPSSGVASTTGSASAVDEGSGDSSIASTTDSAESSEASSASSAETTSSTSSAPAATSAPLPAAQDGSKDLPPMPPHDGGMPPFDPKHDKDHRPHGRGDKPPHMRREGSGRDDFAAGSFHGPFGHHHRHNATEDVGSSKDGIGAEAEVRGNNSHPAWDFHHGPHHGHHNGTNGTHVKPHDTVPNDNATTLPNEESSAATEGSVDVLPQ